MEEQKKFQKTSLNSDDYKGAVRGAKAAKGLLGSAFTVVLAILNKDKIKAFIAETYDIVKNVIK